MFQDWKPTKVNGSVWAAKGGHDLNPHPKEEGHNSHDLALGGLT